MRTLVRSLLTSGFARYWASRLAPPGAQILFAHRFSGERSERGFMQLAMLDLQLAWIREAGIPVLSLRDAVLLVANKEPIADGAVVFTVDDGYADFAPAAEVFRKYACPVTLFVTTGFVDGGQWMWWDRVAWAIVHGDPVNRTIRVGDLVAECSIAASSDRYQVARDFACTVEPWPMTSRLEAIDLLEQACGVVVPSRPPAEFSALTWDALRSLERQGIDFAPHTVSHPILSACSDEDVEHEIRDSWTRCVEELRNPVPVFAYPNGTSFAFGAREEQLVLKHGLLAAVSCLRGRASSSDIATCLPRFPHPHSFAGLQLQQSGAYELLARFKLIRST